MNILFVCNAIMLVMMLACLYMAMITEEDRDKRLAEAESRLDTLWKLAEKAAEGKETYEDPSIRGPDEDTVEESMNRFTVPDFYDPEDGNPERDGD